MSDEIWEEERQEYINVIRWLQNQMAFANNLTAKNWESLSVDIGGGDISLLLWGPDYEGMHKQVISFGTAEELFDFLTDDPETKLRELLHPTVQRPT